MDCIIPSHSIRPFCAAIGCLSRIGKELYLDFDPIDGLTLRALNDAKSAFGSFHYEPSFFQRCSSAPRTPTTTTTKTKRRKLRHSASSHGNNRRTTVDHDDNEQEEDDDDDRWCVKVAMKSLAPVVRPRKDVLSLQVVTTGDLLSFEFQIQRPQDDANSIVRVIHSVGVAPAQSVAAVAVMEGSSEIIVEPTVVLKMLDPLKTAVEMALFINETHKVVSSATFAHDDVSQETSSSVMIGAARQKSSKLKTETSIAYDEVIEIHYVSHYDVDEDDEPNPPPENLKDHVTLVFTIKEFKALLTFCAQAYGAGGEQELPITIQFFWGGKPMAVTAQSEGFRGQLIMATLDHKLLGSSLTSRAAAGGGQ